jgi:hypothetical protein
MTNSSTAAHILLDIRDEILTTLEDVAYLEMVGFRVTDRRQLAAEYDLASLQPDVVVLEFLSTPDSWTEIHAIRMTRRMANLGIVVVCPERNWRPHQEAHVAGADVFLPVRSPGLEWTARGVCTALASHGRSADVLGFERRVRLGARLCGGIRTREARILLFDAPDLPLLWRLLQAGYAATPTNVTCVRRAPKGTERPDLVVVDVDAQPEAVPFILDKMHIRPPILCVTESPTTPPSQIPGPSERDVRFLSKMVSTREFIAIVEGLATAGDGSDPPEPEPVSRRAPVPYRSRTDSTFKTGDIGSSTHKRAGKALAEYNRRSDLAFPDRRRSGRTARR